MLAASSKRAFSSTSTATCLPFCAAVISESRMAPPEVRYSVILMASTFGSLAAVARKRSTVVEKDS
jgi:hypothetical protein